MKGLNVFMRVVFAIYLSQTLSAYAEELNDKTVLVSVNGEEITLGNVVSFQSRLSAEYRGMDDSDLFDGILRQLIQQTILAQQIDIDSRDIEYGLENHIRAFLANELVANLSKIEVTEKEIKDLYFDFSENFQPKTEFKASHILLENKSEAIEILDKLKNGSDFSELAKLYSTGPSGEKGGNLGWFGKGAMVPAFEKAVFSLKINEVSEPIETQFGWHVIKVLNIRDTTAPRIEEIRGELISKIKQNRIEAKINYFTDSANVIFSNLEIDPKIVRQMSILKD